MQHFFTPQELEQDFQIINAMPQGEGAIGFSVLNNAFSTVFRFVTDFSRLLNIAAALSLIH